MSTGVDLIAAERQRQIEQEGWTPDHDREHDNDALARAAVCYAMPGDLRRLVSLSRGFGGFPAWWPWDVRFWKPTPDDRVRELTKAGALIAAEIDRLTPKDVPPTAVSPSPVGSEGAETGVVPAGTNTGHSDTRPVERRCQCGATYCVDRDKCLKCLASEHIFPR